VGGDRTPTKFALHVKAFLPDFFWLKRRETFRRNGSSFFNSYFAGQQPAASMVRKNAEGVLMRLQSNQENKDRRHLAHLSRVLPSVRGVVWLLAIQLLQLCRSKGGWVLVRLVLGLQVCLLEGGL